jgi:O-antigen ligase
MVLLLVLVGEINPTLRLVIQLMAIVLLLFIVLRKYGFDIKKYPRLPSLVLSLIIFLYTALAISILNSDYSFAAIPLVLRLSAFFIFVYLFFVMIKNVEDVRLYINALIVSAIIVALGTLYDFVYTGFNLLIVAGEIYRTGGFIGNYNATGGYFAISIPLLISSLYVSKLKIKRIMISAIIGLLFIALIITGSRSAFLACAVSVFIILFILNKKLLIRIAVSSVLSILFLLLIEPIRDFLILALRVESGLTHRDHLWKISLDLIEDNFLFGIGPGAYAFKMLDYFPVMLDSYLGQRLIGLYEMTTGRNSAHNFYLVMFTDLGILGLFVSLMLPYVFFRISKPVLRHLKKIVDSSYYIVVGIVSTMTGLLVRSLFDGINIMSYGWISVDLPFWLMFSILIYFYNNIDIAKKLFAEVQKVTKNDH